MPTRCTRDEAVPATSAGRCTPLVRALALHGVSGDSGSHLGSTLKPGGAVLTLGVFRRSRSVACIRADASPSEVLASVMVPSNSKRVNLARATVVDNRDTVRACRRCSLDSPITSQYVVPVDESRKIYGVRQGCRSDVHISPGIADVRGELGATLASFACRV